jgi:outer membrane lipoprotein SlyB
MRRIGTLLASGALLFTAACTGMTQSEQGALSGAAIGGVAGAVLGDDEAALAGAAVGAAAGWYLGCRQEGRCGNVENRRQSFDQRTGRYYFYDPQSRAYFYENGEPYRG